MRKMVSTDSRAAAAAGGEQIIESDCKQHIHTYRRQIHTYNTTHDRQTDRAEAGARSQ